MGNLWEILNEFLNFVNASQVPLNFLGWENLHLGFPAQENNWEFPCQRKSGRTKILPLFLGLETKHFWQWWHKCATVCHVLHVCHDIVAHHSTLVCNIRYSPSALLYRCQYTVLVKSFAHLYIVTTKICTHWLGDAEEIDLFHTIDFML